MKEQPANVAALILATFPDLEPQTLERFDEASGFPVGPDSLCGEMTRARVETLATVFDTLDIDRETMRDLLAQVWEEVLIDWVG